jgi:hypothetical protein
MTDWPFAVGDVVTPMADENTVWPSLAVAPVGTIVLDSSDGGGILWTRRRWDWSEGLTGAQVTSVQLARRGPLVVKHVHIHEHEWVDITSWGSAMLESICTGCPETKETPR